MQAIFGTLGFAVAMLTAAAPVAAAADPPKYHVECTAHPGVTTSGDEVVFSGFIRCDPFVKGGTIFVLAYVGDREAQDFKERTDKKCPIDDERCDGVPLSLPNPPGLQTFCSSTEAFIGTTSRTVEVVRGQLCLER
jgi:hypothetical protein